MSSPITFMVRRARLIRGETQGEFAVHMGVDQATVSRWERSKSEPTPAKLGKIRKIISVAEPSHSAAYIMSSPTFKYLCKLDDFSKPLLLSKGLLEAFGVALEDVLENPQAFWAEGAQRVNEAVQADPRWRRGEIAFFEAIHKANPTRLPNRWWRTIGAPVAEANAMLWEGVLDPKPNEFWIQMTPFEVLDDDA